MEKPAGILFITTIECYTEHFAYSVIKARHNCYNLSMPRTLIGLSCKCNWRPCAVNSLKASEVHYSHPCRIRLTYKHTLRMSYTMISMTGNFVFYRFTIAHLVLHFSRSYDFFAYSVIWLRNTQNKKYLNFYRGLWNRKSILKTNDGEKYSYWSFNTSCDFRVPISSALTWCNHIQTSASSQQQYTSVPQTPTINSIL